MLWFASLDYCFKRLTKCHTPDSARGKSNVDFKVNNVYLFLTSLTVKLGTSNKLQNYWLLSQYHMNANSIITVSWLMASRAGNIFNRRAIANADDQQFIVDIYLYFTTPLSPETSNKVQIYRILKQNDIRLILTVSLQTAKWFSLKKRDIIYSDNLQLQTSGQKCTIIVYFFITFLTVKLETPKKLPNYQLILQIHKISKDTTSQKTA